MNDKQQILLADDETNLRRVLRMQLERDGYEVHDVQNGALALQELEQQSFDCVITDLRMPVMDGMELLRACHERFPELPVVVITAHGTIHNAVEALKLGAFDYITKPFERSEFQLVIEKALRTRELAKEHVVPERSNKNRYRMIGQSPKIQKIYDLIDKAADTPATVLILGESGTGKELIAEALHDHSRRKDAPLVRINCAAIPRELIESELFGYEKGAFTGAVTNKPGRFELADNGTLFLDEIGEIPLAMQVKLLRVLQDQTFQRVGSVKTTKVEVRLIAATNQNLELMVQQGRFREDLFYRLNVVQIFVPPLRERPDDIPLLVAHFLEKHSARSNKNVHSLKPEALDALCRYSWPGNIRQLENTIERCVIFADGPEIGVEELLALADIGSTDNASAAPQPPIVQVGGLKQAVKEATSKLERDLIVKALSQTSGNVSRSARLLKISRKSLQNKMKELGLRET